jgi:hypothetical protein
MHFASDFYLDHTGSSYVDRAITMIQSLVDNPLVGGQLINATWAVLALDNATKPFVLSDRPLIRIHGFDKPGATWVLPLSPTAAFVAVNDPKNLERLQATSQSELVERTNISSAAQAEKFVFSIASDSEEWLSGYLASSKPVK